MESFYGKQLAYIHDAYYGDIARSAASEILGKTRERRPTKVIDLGCGSGILAALLSESGMQVIGVDISEDFLNIARQKAPKATFIKASLFDYAFEPTDLITAIGEPFNYVFNQKTTYQELARLFERVHQNLNESGTFMFDLLTDDVEPAATARIVEKEDMTLFVEINIDREESLLTRKMVYFTKDVHGYQKGTETHRQFLFNAEAIQKIVTETGFDCQQRVGYSDLLFRKGHFAFVCQKARSAR